MRHVEHVMGTVVSFDVRFAPALPEMPWVALARARAALRRADAVFSTWKENSPMSCLRRGELELSEAPEVVRDVLELCAEARRWSGGWFDPWAMPGGVDPTGLVKGWAAQKALGELVAAGVSGALVNAAGDIASHGGPEPGTAWRVGVQDPFAADRLACVVELTGAIATSGTYERGAHLVDPHTGRPAARLASASVCGPDLALADAMATALMVAGEGGVDLLADLPGYEAYLIRLDGSVRPTSGFPIVAGAGT
ncbi:MAG TPA: FAD:protein FMN transferase [Acidimicrobiales bacterium]|nr:FAD:protein FMN transferase [Acidimicrobiales bacterium]